MLQPFAAAPGRLYIVATLLPLAAFVLLLIAGGLRGLCRPYRHAGGFAGSLYWLLGGDKPLKTGAYFCTAVMAAAAALGVLGLVLFLGDAGQGLKPEEMAARWAERTDWVRIGRYDTAPPGEWQRQQAGNPDRPVPAPALALELGYKIDHLTALMFAMVTVIGTAIFVFSLGYMKDETNETVVDQEVSGGEGETGRGGEGTSETHPVGHSVSPSPLLPLAPSPLRRRGRFGRFFLYLSLFCFSMLNLVIADNLFQVFVSWELVGLCSFLLIGFYYEREKASYAANKAFVVNRIGDAGFLVGLLLAWTYLGTLNFEEMNRRLRSPERDTHGRLELAHQLVRVNPAGKDESGNPQYRLPPREEAGTGSHLALFPLLWEDPTHFHGLGYERFNDKLFSVPARADYFQYGVIPYWLFVAMGLGVFLGCVGKSAQVPLHTWLPDAMEGPTPVSALIHAATMVAAGVYLVGRCFFLFAPEVLLVIAYTGAVTLFVTATIALVQTDIKRVLAYSTCSQLGFMMLALGVGGWVAGLLHLLTHAFFKALLFLCSGSVIHGCHHQQDLRKMGGLRARMPVTAFTMLVGVLAISGAPLLSGWYSKDMILSASLGYAAVHREHALLFALPALTAGMTAYYMFRLWFLAFTGPPRDHHVHEHAHESPWVMTLPLVFLAVCSVGIAWGWPVWNVEASYLGHLLERGEPALLHGPSPERVAAHDYHTLAGVVALAFAVAGVALATYVFYVRRPATDALYDPGGPGVRFLRNKWYFDEAYDAAFLRPTVELARATAAADKRPTDAPAPPDLPEPPPRRFDLRTLDGLLNAVGQVADAVGQSLRAVQTGRLRTYVLFLALTAAVLLGILTVLTG